jgi:hypothetical protein
VLKFLYEDQDLSWREKFDIYSSEKVFISFSLIMCYIASFKVQPLLGFVAGFELLNIRYVNKLANIQNKALISSLFDIAIFLCLIAMYFGLMEWETPKNYQFMEEIIYSFKEFYTFVSSNFKITLENDYTFSKKYPYSFFLYISLIAFFIYKYLLLFIAEIKKDND